MGIQAIFGKIFCCDDRCDADIMKVTVLKTRI
jgi:hypothetical protein